MLALQKAKSHWNLTYWALLIGYAIMHFSKDKSCFFTGVNQSLSFSSLLTSLATESTFLRYSYCRESNYNGMEIVCHKVCIGKSIKALKIE